MLLEHVEGDGWLMWAGVRLGIVSYVIDLWRVERTSDPMQDGTQTDVRLIHHSVTVPQSADGPLTLHLADGRTLSGFLSADGSRFVRTSPLQPA
jgi:hypothetical protein